MEKRRILWVASERWPFIRMALALDVAFAIVWYLWWGWAWLLLAVGLVLTVWVVAFFRDPDRPGPRGDELVIAPADGRVCGIVQVDEPMYLRQPAIRISIFMSIFDVHVNRFPVSGAVEMTHYNPGQFAVASHDKASLLNEQASIGIRWLYGLVLVRLIAGIIARRIVTNVEVDDWARQGHRFGMIRFGSRVDVFVPLGTAIKVALGQKVRAGQTIIAQYAPE